jgi:MFS family permease
LGISWSEHGPRQLALATAGMGAGAYLTIGVAALIPLIRQDLAISGPAIGALASTPWVTAALFSLPAAAVVDRIGAGISVSCAQLLIAAGASITALAPATPFLFLGAAVYGLGFGILNPATNVLSTSATSVSSRGLAMSVQQTGVTIAGAAAGLSLPGIAALTSWRVAVVVAIGLLCSVAWFGFRTRTTSDRRPLVLSDRTVDVRRRRLAVYGFVMSGTQLLILAYTAVYLVDGVGVSPQAAGVGLALVLCGATAGCLVWGTISDRSRGRLQVLQVTAAASGLMLLLLPFAPRPAIWPVLLVLGFCAASWNGMFLTVVAESAGPRGVGRAISFVFIFMYAGCVSLPPLFGFVVEGVSWRWFWLIAAGGALTSALSLQRMPRRRLPEGTGVPMAP